jgi:DNA-binding response OmpR family regulator
MLSQPKQILLVDDHEDMCEMMTLFLGFSDYQVHAAQTMAEGWQLAQSRAFDLCLLDSRLPDGRGYELCR